MNPLPADSPTTAHVHTTSHRVPCLLRLGAMLLLTTWAGNLLLRLLGVATLAPPLPPPLHAPDAIHLQAVWAQTSGREWMHWLWYGLRYDMLLASWGMAVWLLPLAVIRARFAPYPMARTVFSAGVIAWFVMMDGLALAEHFYMRDFGAPFGPQLFSQPGGVGAFLHGFGRDASMDVAPQEVKHLTSLVMALASAGCLGAAQAWCTFRFAMVPEREATWRDALVQVLTVSTVLVLGWGRPAARLMDDSGISVARAAVLDDHLVNTPVRLVLAFKQYREAGGAFVPPERAADIALRSHGFADTAALAKALDVAHSGEVNASEGVHVTDASDASDSTNVTKAPAEGAPTATNATATLLRAPWHRTPVNDVLAAHPPHVVFGLLEGWGGYGLSLDADGFPVAGAMRRHLEAGWWFRHAVAARADTFGTLEQLLIDSGSEDLLLTDATSPVVFKSSVALPFRQRGYRTVFVYGGARTWHNIDRIVRRQGFDDVATQADIVARYPHADAGGYGVYDGYLWRYVHDMLEDADAQGQPLFVFALTTSNRWPYRVPDDAATGPFDLTKGWRASPADEVAREARQRGMRAYRYAMDSLGDFIDRLKYSPMSSRTILAATGDHQAPQWRNDDNATLSPFEQYHVPIYLRVPSAYAPTDRPRLDDFVGHRDIFPTLYRLALSDIPYVGFGEPMFGDVPAVRRYAVAQQRYLFSTAGAQDLRSGVTYTHAPQGDPEWLRRQAAHANASLALADWFSEMQRLQTPMMPMPPPMPVTEGSARQSLQRPDR
ncbi:LTA synthase family protein [Pandoraea captiosa]|nr:LTA synthase family protein [Pandoraea captiosa]